MGLVNKLKEILILSLLDCVLKHYAGHSGAQKMVHCDLHIFLLTYEYLEFNDHKLHHYSVFLFDV